MATITLNLPNPNDPATTDNWGTTLNSELKTKVEAQINAHDASIAALAAGTAPDATLSSKGVVQLGGDLGGTAAAPKVLKVNGVTVSGTPAVGQAPVATSSTTATWQTVTGGTGGGTAAVDNGDGVGTLGVVGTGTVTSRTITGTAYTLVLGDAGNVVEQNSTNLLTVTVPTDASQAIPVGSTIELYLYGTGSITVAAASGVVVNSPGNAYRLTTRHATAALRKRSANEWVLSGYTVV